MSKRMPDYLFKGIARVREAVELSRDGLKPPQDRAMLEALMAEAESWKMELEEMEE